MSVMFEKAMESWELAEGLRSENAYANFAANRYYYALYQLVCWYNESSAGKRMVRGQTTAHVFARDIVRDITGQRRHLQTVFRKLRSLRERADYEKTNVEKEDLNDLLIKNATELRDYLIQLGGGAGE